MFVNSQRDESVYDEGTVAPEESSQMQNMASVSTFHQDQLHELHSTSTVTSSESGQSGTKWYKGRKLSIAWLISSNEHLKLQKREKDNRVRPFINCALCNRFEKEVKKYTSNGQLPIASGIRVDGTDRLKLMIDHLQSDVHTEALKLERYEQQWNEMSDKHPWARYAKNAKAETLKILLEMSLDVYNDSRTETLSARSWPARYLTSTMSENLFQKFNKDGWDVNFVPFNPSASAFHYKDPMVYAEMKSIVGSADRQQIDSKFITARLVPSEEIGVQVFVSW